MRFSEFAEMFYPIDRTYREHLEKKRPNYDAKNPEDAFSGATKNDMCDLIRKTLRNEGFVEEYRQLLSKKYRFSYSQAFSIIDANKNGFLAKDEFQSVLEEGQFFATSKELDMMLNRFDRDRDGKVTYSEFFQELAPKDS
mmetsp:Transcript_344/g.380  ORF Transcript_344/g.380 Transcript_344/m.380 type:complete len:140 (+) Transcript_344:608-1027(+)